LVAHLHFLPTHNSTLKNAKELPSQRTKTAVNMNSRALTDRTPVPNSTYPKGGVSCSADSLVVTGSLVLRIKFSAKTPRHRKPPKR